MAWTRETDEFTARPAARRQVYRFTLHTAVAVATVEPSGATRWRFER